MNPSPALRVGAGLVILGNLLNIASHAVQPLIRDYTNTVEVFTARLGHAALECEPRGRALRGDARAGRLLVLVRAFRSQPGEGLFNLAAANALLGVPVIAIMMGLDLAQRQLAGQLLTLPTEALATAVWAGHTLHYASFAIFTLLLILASATPALLGGALLLDKRPPRWIGWAILLGVEVASCGGFFPGSLRANAMGHQRPYSVVGNLDHHRQPGVWRLALARTVE